MKKLFSLILVLTLVLSLATVASAKEIDATGTDSISTNDTVTGDVQITVAAPPSKIYCVTVSWDSLVFKYTFNGDLWNPDTHTYQSGNGAWDKQSADITVANHSNAPVSYAASLDANTYDRRGVTVGLAGETEKTLPTAENTPVNSAPKGVFQVTVAGVPNTGSINETTIAQVTIKISAA